MKIQRYSRQRQVILDTLRSVKTHPTASELYEQVRLEIPRISLGTVYRNLEQLVEYGEIQKLDHVGAQSRFDGISGFHPHIQCSSCGRVDDVMKEEVLYPEIKKGNFQGYTIHGMRMEFIGICPSCRKAGRMGNQFTAMDKEKRKQQKGVTK